MIDSNPQSRDHFINDINKNISLPQELKNKLSKKIKCKLQTNSDNKKELKIELSKLKSKLEKYFENCVVIDISTFSKQDALNIIQQLKSQNAICFGKTTHNNCHYQFIVDKDFTVSNNYKEYVLITAKKASYKHILDFYLSLTKRKVVQKSGYDKVRQLFDQLFAVKQDIKNLKMKLKLPMIASILTLKH